VAFAIEDVGMVYVSLVYFTAIWYILWALGIFYGYLVIFSRFGMLWPEKSGNPGKRHCRKKRRQVSGQSDFQAEQSRLGRFG
jgi:hypothetical protein